MNDSPGARRGRWAGLALFFALVVSFTAICSFQIIQQAWEEPPETAPVECEEGLRALLASIERARRKASAVPGEGPTLEAFRAGLLPEWSTKSAVLASCARRSGPEGEARVEEIERLRYAEERALRYEAPELAELRRRVQGLTGTRAETP